MRIELRKAIINGRDKRDRLIYPEGSWTIWNGSKFLGWNWHWDRVWEGIWNGKLHEELIERQKEFIVR